MLPGLIDLVCALIGSAMANKAYDGYGGVMPKIFLANGITVTFPGGKEIEPEKMWDLQEA